MGRKPLPKNQKKQRIWIMLKTGEVKQAGGERKVQQILKDKWAEHLGLPLKVQQAGCFLFLLPTFAETIIAIIIVTIVFIILLRWQIISGRWHDEFDERDNYN
jgi:hypothetical protein